MCDRMRRSLAQHDWDCHRRRHRGDRELRHRDHGYGARGVPARPQCRRAAAQGQTRRQEPGPVRQPKWPDHVGRESRSTVVEAGPGTSHPCRADAARAERLARCRRLVVGQAAAPWRRAVRRRVRPASTASTTPRRLGQQRRAGDVADDSAGPDQSQRVLEQSTLTGHQGRQVIGLLAPARLGTAAQGPGARAWGVEQHPVEPVHPTQRRAAGRRRRRPAPSRLRADRLPDQTGTVRQQLPRLQRGPTLCGQSARAAPPCRRARRTCRATAPPPDPTGQHRAQPATTQR